MKSAQLHEKQSGTRHIGQFAQRIHDVRTVPRIFRERARATRR